MREKLLKEIVVDIAGEAAEPLVDLLDKKKNVNEFLIAKKLDLTINQTRNLLYKLSDMGLVSFVRKKDAKKGGWYIYYWTLDSGKSIELLKAKIISRLDSLEDELGKRNTQRFYYSEGADLEYTEEEALEHGFICPETGEVLVLKDTGGDVSQLNDEINILKENLEFVEKELEFVESQRARARARRIRVEDLKKKKLREERAKKRKKVKKKTKKKVKKKVKKAKKKTKKKTKKKVKKKAVKKKAKKKAKKKTKKAKKTKKKK